MKRYCLFWLLIVGLSTMTAAGAPKSKKETKKEPATAPAVVKKVATTQPVYLDPENAPRGRAKGWIPLFNGKDLTGWKPRHGDKIESWKVVDGVLINSPSKDKGGQDIVSDQKFKDFDVYYEYRIPQGSNSGFYLRGRYEIQILDDHGQTANPSSNGAVYSLGAPSRNVSRKPGEWQSVFAKIVGRKITVVLNGVKIVENFEATRPTGGELDRNETEPGPVMLQGDHGAVEFRHVLLRPILGVREKPGKAKEAKETQPKPPA
jgi:hypothetical protein